MAEDRKLIVPTYHLVICWYEHQLSGLAIYCNKIWYLLLCQVLIVAYELSFFFPNTRQQLSNPIFLLKKPNTSPADSKQQWFLVAWPWPDWGHSSWEAGTERSEQPSTMNSPHLSPNLPCESNVITRLDSSNLESNKFEKVLVASCTNLTCFVWPSDFRSSSSLNTHTECLEICMRRRDTCFYH